MPPSNLTNNERAYYLAPRGETFRKNPNAKYRYLYFKVHGRKFENDHPNAPTVNYGPFAKMMGGGNAKNFNNERQLLMPRSPEFLANPPAWFRNLTLKATGKPYVAPNKTKKNRRANRKTRRNRRS